MPGEVDGSNPTACFPFVSGVMHWEAQQSQIAPQAIRTITQALQRHLRTISCGLSSPIIHCLNTTCKHLLSNILCPISHQEGIHTARQGTDTTYVTQQLSETSLPPHQSEMFLQWVLLHLQSFPHCHRLRRQTLDNVNVLAHKQFIIPADKHTISVVFPPPASWR